MRHEALLRAVRSDVNVTSLFSPSVKNHHVKYPSSCHPHLPLTQGHPPWVWVPPPPPPAPDSPGHAVPSVDAALLPGSVRGAVAAQTPPARHPHRGSSWKRQSTHGKRGGAKYRKIFPKEGREPTGRGCLRIRRAERYLLLGTRTRSGEAVSFKAKGSRFQGSRRMLRRGSNHAGLRVLCSGSYTRGETRVGF